jgi:long-chain acyl-CoA synthetase
MEKILQEKILLEKTWLKSYPPGVPEQADVAQFPSLNALLESSCARFSALPALTNQGAHLAYQEFDDISRTLAAYLQQGARVERGDRIAIMLPNLLQYPLALFAALRAGCIVVNCNPLYTAHELRRQLIDCGATCIIVLENFAHTLQEALPGTAIRHVITTGIGDLLHFPRAQLTNFIVRHVKHMVPEWRIECAVSFGDALARGADMGWTDPSPQAADIAFLQYTGGTTGVPKAAMLTHGNMVANVQQTAAWVHGVLDDGAETAVIPLPLYHVFALTALLTFLKLGANNVLITNPRDLPGFIKELTHTPSSAIIGVNTLFGALLDAPGIEQIDHAHLKVVIAGGMAVQRSVAERWQQLFGLPIIEGYGLTETSPIVCANPLNITQYTGMIGLPLPSTEVAILDDNGDPLPIGAAGEIGIRGPQVMQGYWKQAFETANVFSLDGWLRSGDIGVMDARGYVKLLDRKKDVIVVSGFKVFPNEVEDIVALHPGVLEVVAIPAVDERCGEVVRIVVVRRDPALTFDDLIAHCKHYLTGYKMPRQITFRTEPLPKSTIGKILRRIVRDEERAQQASNERPTTPANSPGQPR